MAVYLAVFGFWFVWDGEVKEYGIWTFLAMTALVIVSEIFLSRFQRKSGKLK